MNSTEKRLRVLVVDDNPKIIKIIEVALKLHGFEVISKTSGNEALELIDLAKPDIVLLDIIMPDIDGFVVLRKLRTFNQLPVIAFSADLGNQQEALRLGANDFMHKPFDIDVMARRIKALLRSRD